MRHAFHSTRALLLPLTALTLLFVPLTARAQTPQITAFVGTGTQTSFLTLDFRAGAAPQSYAFGYRYEGAKTGQDFLNALVAGLTGFEADGVTSGFITRFEYDGKERADAFPNGSWYYWLGTNGFDWTFSNVGIAGRTLTNGSWDGWSYDSNNGSDFDNNGDLVLANAELPRTPVTSSAAAPEPATLGLLALGLTGFAVRRRHRPVCR